MAIEIREIIIKTEIRTGNQNKMSSHQPEELTKFKKKLLDECRSMIAIATKKSINNR